jgi:hypothetical protein
MTTPFDRVSLAPASPTWIVRQIIYAEVDTIEIVFVGHCNRLELDSHVERLARWPWHYSGDATEKSPAGVTVLADSRAEMIGVRIVGCSLSSSQIRDVLVDLFGREIVCQAFRADVARQLTQHDEIGK